MKERKGEREKGKKEGRKKERKRKKENKKVFHTSRSTNLFHYLLVAWPALSTSSEQVCSYDHFRTMQPIPPRQAVVPAHHATSYPLERQTCIPRLVTGPARQRYPKFLLALLLLLSSRASLLCVTARYFPEAEQVLFYPAK